MTDSSRRAAFPVAMLLLVAFPAARPAGAGELWRSEDGESSVSLDTTLKWSALVAHNPDDDVLFPERRTATGLFRLRFGLDAQHGSRINAKLAYEHRARLVSENAGAGAGSGGVLPDEADVPFRLAQLDWQIAEKDETFVYRHEFDRALVALHPDWGEVTLGRQGVGLGRGVLFSAVDVFAPFTPTEVDREWRRGVDAARVECRVSDTSSAEVISAFGESWDESALLGRFRGYAGSLDGELLVGKRGEDAMYALAASSTVGNAEVHMELALFDLPDPWPEDGPFEDEHLVAKALAGASHTFDVGNGLTLIGEYHYSGFGVEDIDDAAARLADPEYRERLLRGDTQTLGRHAVGLSASYPIDEALGVGLTILGSPVDGSGLASPSVTWNATSSATLVVSAFLPWGEEPSGGRLESEYGGTPASLFVHLSLYF